MSRNTPNQGGRSLLFRLSKPDFVLVLLMSCLSPLCLVAEETGANPKTIVTDIRFTGNTEMAGVLLRQELPFKPQGPLAAEDVVLGERLITALYHRLGYLEAATKGELTLVDDRVILTYHVREGPLYRFGETRVTGLQKLPLRAVDFRLAYRTGDPYRRSDLFRTQGNLYGTGYFEDVTVSASTTTARIAEVTIHVTERPFKWIKGGVGWGSEEKERVTLSLTHNNFLRRAYTAELRGTLSRIWKDYQLTFLNPYFFDTRTEARVSSSWRQEHREGYDFERTRAETSLGRWLTAFISGSVALRYDRNLTYGVDPVIAAVTPSKVDGRSVSVGFSRDTSNDIFMPTLGTRTNLVLDRSGGFLGGGLHFNKARLETRVYAPVYRSIVGAVALRSGIVNEFGDSPEVPIYERFFIGGANTVRGYSERDIGPQDEEGAPLGGEYMLGATLEFRYPIYKQLRGAVFVDGGQVGFEPQDVSVEDWKYGAGVGLRYVTPVGPFRLDYGHKLNPDTRDRDHWRIHLSLGESF